MPLFTAADVRRLHHSFTIVEVLVVIGIISALIAILFPVLAKARRGALVLACPIAYVGQDGGLYLTNVNGSAELQISRPGWRVDSRQGLDSPMAWSPSGRILAFQCFDMNAQSGGSYFMDVMTGQTRSGRGGRFGGWIDNDTYLGSGAYAHQTFTVDTGRPVDFFRLPDDRHYDTFSLLPRTVDGSFIASLHGDYPSYIAIIGKDYQPRRPIYFGPAIGTHHHMTPRVDPMGEWVAWSFQETLYVHSLKGSSRTPASPLRLPNEYTSAEFCDWTEDGRMLINVTVKGGSGALVVVEPDGKTFRTISTTVPPAPRSVATYRKYEHR